MALHLVLETLCITLGLVLYSAARKNPTPKFILLSAFGVFLFIVNSFHFIISVHGNLIQNNEEVLIPMTWLIGAMCVPFWFLVLGERQRVFKSWQVITYITTTTLILIVSLNWGFYHISNWFISRPLDFIPIIIGFFILPKIWNSNGRAMILRISMILFMCSQLALVFSKDVYDNFYFIGHALKLSYQMVVILLASEGQVMREELNHLVDEERKLVS